MLRDGLHARLRDAHIASVHRAPNEGELPPADLQRAIQEHAAEEGAEEAINHAIAEASHPECMLGGIVFHRQDLVHVHLGQFAAHGQQPNLVEVGEVGAHRHGQHGVAVHFVVGVVPSHQAAGLKRAQTEGAFVQFGFGVRVLVEIHLEPLVQRKSVHLIGAEASAGPIPGFHNQDLMAASKEVTRTNQAREAGANNDDGTLHSACGFTQPQAEPTGPR